MNHRVSIVVNQQHVSDVSTESGIGTPEVCSKASCLSKSVFSKECVHCTFFFFFFLRLNHAQSLLALRLSCFVSYIVFLSRVRRSTVVPTQGPSTPLNREFSSISSCSFFFFIYFANLPFTVERYDCLCVASFKLLMQKI